MTKALTVVPRVLAIDVCPNGRRCQHQARSTIGGGGRCPDCGTQVYPPGARLGGAPSSRGAALYTQMAYHGGYEA